MVPRTPGEATALAFDLDGNGKTDNALGGLFAALDGQTGYSLATRTDNAVATGRLLELASVAPSIAEIALRRGADLDDDPEDNLSGAEPFSLVPVEGADGYLYGSSDGATLTAGPGHAPMQLAFDSEVPVLALSGLEARVRLTVMDDGLVDGVVGFALLPETVDQQVLPLVADGIEATVERECSGSSDPYCPPGSEGERLLNFFDDNRDGAVTLIELQSNSLISSTLGNPDLDLFDEEGVPSPQGDGIRDSLSFAVGFTAVGAVVAE